MTRIDKELLFKSIDPILREEGLDEAVKKASEVLSNSTDKPWDVSVSVTLSSPEEDSIKRTLACSGNWYEDVPVRVSPLTLESPKYERDQNLVVGNYDNLRKLSERIEELNLLYKTFRSSEELNNLYLSIVNEFKVDHRLSVNSEHLWELIRPDESRNKGIVRSFRKVFSNPSIYRNPIIYDKKLRLMRDLHGIPKEELYDFLREKGHHEFSDNFISRDNSFVFFSINKRYHRGESSRSLLAKIEYLKPVNQL